MVEKARKTSRVAGVAALVFLSLQFLGSDFCQDVLSIPLKVDYKSAEIDILVDFTPEGAFIQDANIEDIETPAAVEYKPDGYVAFPQHLTVDFTDSESGGTAGLLDYKGNVLGVFIRVVSMEVIENSIPAEIYPMDVFISPKVQHEEGDITFDNKTAHLENGEYTDPVTGVAYADWNTLLSDESYKDWNLPNLGVGEHGMVKLGVTEPILCMQPGEDWPDNELALPYCTVPSGFPAADKRIIRELGNIDALSGIITENFRFELIIIPKEHIVVDEEIWNNLDKSKDWKLKIRLHFIVVISAKA